MEEKKGFLEKIDNKIDLLRDDVQELKDEVQEVKTSIGGNEAFGMKGIKHRVEKLENVHDEHEVRIKNMEDGRWKERFAIGGIAGALGASGKALIVKIVSFFG